MWPNATETCMGNEETTNTTTTSATSIEATADEDIIAFDVEDQFVFNETPNPTGSPTGVSFACRVAPYFLVQH